MRKLLLATGIMLMLSACASKQEKADQKDPRAAIPVNTLTLGAVDMPQTFTASGTVTARTTATLASRIMAQVLSVNVHEGDHVTAGETLIALDAQELDAKFNSVAAAKQEVTHSKEVANLEISQAKANLDLAEATHRRLTDLYEKRSISNQEFDESTAKLKLAQAAYQVAHAHVEQADSRDQQSTADLHAAEISRDYSRIKAPFQGIVIMRNVEPGVTAMPGSTLLTLEREGNYRLEAAVPETHLGKIQRGEKVPVEIEVLAQQVMGTVSEMSPTTNAETRSATVKLDLPALAGLHSGMFGKALFSEGHQETLTVPANAVIEHGQLLSVLVSDAGVARNRLITTGAMAGSSVVVLSGLSKGDRLIYPVPPNVSDGTAVEVRK